MRQVRIYLVATVLAAVVPTLVGLMTWAMAGGSLNSFRVSMAFSVASTHVLYLGLPAFLLLHQLELVRWWSLPAVGFALGTIPLGPMNAPLQDSPATVFMAGLLGLSGGMAAWVVIHYSGVDD